MLTMNCVRVKFLAVVLSLTLNRFSVGFTDKTMYVLEEEILNFYI